MDYLSVGRQTSTPSTSDKGDGSNNEDLEVDNSKSVLKKIATLYAEQLMSDLTLEVGGVSYPAHRLILCASSEVFQVMLMSREWSEWRETRISLQETPAATDVFPYFLKYFYTGQIRISHNTVLPVLSLADKYNVKDLVTLCLSYMLQHIAQAAQLGHLVCWMQYTMACGHNHVAKACVNFIKWNLEWAWGETGAGGAGGGGLCDVEADALLALLNHSDLVLHNEYTLYNFVVRWLEKQREKMEASDLSEEERKTHWEQLVVAVFSNIRFPMMCPNQLAKLLLNPLTQEHKDFFMERMAIAMSYQSGQYERVEAIQSTESGRLLFTPRLYTEDTWGSLVTVDNFHSLPSYHTRTFIFSTRGTLAAGNGASQQLEWTLDLYPKGVWFKKSLLIVWGGTTYDVPEVVLRTVRVSITCHSCPEAVLSPYGDTEYEPDVRVKIGILVWGVQKGVEHVASVVERIHRFSAQNKVLNIDNALDFDELNTPLYTPPADPPAPASATASASASAAHHSRCPKCTESCDAPEPKHLLGPNRDQLKMQVVIVPLTDYCDVGDG